jgi:hypothetical protein
MKPDSSMIPVLLATIAPALVLLLAVVWDRRRKNATALPAQFYRIKAGPPLP